MLNDQKFKFKFVDLLLRADAISCSLFLPILFESLKNSMPILCESLQWLIIERSPCCSPSSPDLQTEGRVTATTGRGGLRRPQGEGNPLLIYHHLNHRAIYNFEGKGSYIV